MIGQTIGSYRIVEQVGMGGMATVYKAYDPGTDRYVAIKVLPEYYSHDPSFRERFRREAKAIAHLEHPHILPIHGYGEEDGTAYLLMRFLPVGTLKDRIGRGSIALAEASVMLTQVADALDYAHERGILHRDIKPSNVLLDERGNVYLSDFGIAKMVGAAGDLTGTGLLGTPAYMSPEQCAGNQNLTPASDQYALGIVVYEMVTGRAPFQAETPLALIHMHLNSPLPPPHQLRLDLPESAEGVILKTLSRDPKDRWPNCKAMAEAFDTALKESGIAPHVPVYSGTTTAEGIDLTFGETIPASPAPRMGKAGHKSASLPMWVWGIVGLVVLGLVIGGLALTGIFGGRAASPILTPEVVEPTTVGEGQSGAAVSTSLPAAASAPTATPDPLAGSEQLQRCGSDLCIVGRDGSKQSLGIGAEYALGLGDWYSWSPDGSQVVFHGCPLDEAASAVWCSNLYLAMSDGSGITPLVNEPNTFHHAVNWSPDGEWIAFSSQGIEVMRSDGTGRHTVVPNSTATCPGYIAWSPDSQRLAWVGGGCMSPPQHDRVWVTSLDGTGLNQIFYSTEGYFSTSESVGWSPDGQSVAATLENGATYLIDADCYLQVNGCNSSFSTSIDTISETWLHTFHPQWAGEPEAEALKVGCQPGEQVLYHQDFENPAAVTQVGEWAVGEAPGGGLALHGNASGEYSNYPLISENINETRIRFRVMPIVESWLINFREYSTQENGDVRYDFIQFRDRNRLTRWEDQIWYELNSNRPLPLNEWTTVEIMWETDSTIVIQVNREEYIRYTENTSLSSQGSINLWLARQYDDTNPEAWFDDFVVCGPK